MRNIVSSLAVIGALAAGGSPALAQEPPDITDLMRAVRLATPEQQEAAVQAVLAAKPAIAEVEVVLMSGVQVLKADAGWSRHEAPDAAGVRRPYHLYVPGRVSRSNDPSPLLVHMHGGVSRPDFTTDAEFAARTSMWTEVADRYGIVLAMPLARRDCAWWSDAGTDHVLAVIRDAKRRAPIADDAVFATGFSDGGSGAYYFALTRPDPWAGLLPLNGHPAVASVASRRQLYPQNASLTRLYCLHTADDSLYPGKSVMPHWQAFLEQGAHMRTFMYPTGDHSPSYIGEQGPLIGEWITSTRRDEVMPLVEWHTAHLETGAARWVRITRLGAVAGEAPAWPDVNVQSTAGRVRLGVVVDQDYRGGGVKLEEVRDGTPAAAMGLRPGDILHSFDGKPLRNLGGLRAALQNKNFGERLTVLVEREGHDTHLELSGEIAPFTPAPVFRRTAPQASIRVEAIGNDVRVTTHHVQAFQFEVRPNLFDLDEPLEIRVNGTLMKTVTLRPSLETLVRGYAERADGGRLVLAIVDVDLAKGPEKNDPGQDF
jgi:poly(3-hydroxybutyrate) depolymerase